MAGRKILVVEDEPDIVNLLAHKLTREGFEVVTADTGEKGLQMAIDSKPDLVVLDIMLPGLNGLDVCRSLRSHDETRDVPVLMLTARDEETDVIIGLEVGADDYVTKPFSLKIVTARIRALLRRRETSDKSSARHIEVGELRIDVERRQVLAAERPIPLTATEFRLLEIMARKPGRVFSRSQLIDRLRDGQQVITDRAIDVQVAHLRRKLGEHGRYIETVRGFGYRMQETP